MFGRAVFLGLLLLCVTADAVDTFGSMRKPSCNNMELLPVCPWNYSPVCGNDGITYDNECTLCVEIRKTRKFIWIVKEERC